MGLGMKIGCARIPLVLKLKLAVMVLTTLLSFAMCVDLWAKETPLTAIVVYQNASGWAYVQASDVLINGRAEMRDCGNTQGIDKSTYVKLPKIRLNPGGSLEVQGDGTLKYKMENTATCVVPDNLKFEKGGSFTAAQLDGRASLDGKPIGSASGLPPLKPGMLIVFVSSPDPEFAEFLMANRASQTSLWDAYLAKYPTAAHSQQAKTSFAHLLAKQSRQHFDLYKSSESSSSPAYAELQTAKQLAVKANSISPADPDVKSINTLVASAVDAITNKGVGELDDYRQALAGKTPGYEHLLTANRLLDELKKIDPQNAPILRFEENTRKQTDSYESDIRSAQNLISSNQVDDALKVVKPYLAFLSEDPRIATIVNSAYTFHLNKGNNLSASNNWDDASREFEIANKIKPSSEAASAIANAKKELQMAKNKADADAALQQSREYASQNQVIAAYEVLWNLPPDQRSFVASDIETLAPSYAKSASQAAQQIAKAHDPIRGLNDEKEIEKAYAYLDRAYAIDAQPAFKEREEDLGDRLSDYDLQQARRYIAKPLGSGVCIGWSYLEKALQYKASNLDAVRDEEKKAEGTYNIRSSLSIRVEFRDQTSRRESAGFADQLADAIATQLENSGVPVKVIRPGDNPIVEPNFQLVGDVVQHVKNVSSNSVSKDSKYRASEELVVNEQWRAANRDYDTAKMELDTARAELEGAMARGKKSEIKDAESKRKEAELKVSAAREKLDSIPQNTTKDVIKPYSYTEKTIRFSAIVELRYHINGPGGETIEASKPILGSNSQTITVLENVKPEDTENVKVQNNMPDENELFTKVEDSTRDELIVAARASVQRLPAKIFTDAQRDERDGDFDAAGENYILYLNSSSSAETSERAQAESFLFEHFNIRRKYGAAF
jgi:hypothetical protein